METLVIRIATEQDLPALHRLASLDEAPVPAGRVLVADVAGETVAALGVEHGEHVADPFRPTADVLALLGAQARRIRVGDRARTTLPERLGIRRPLARTA